uniref:Ion transport domain-containing protein n=1 Tax=Haptolina brevifila TaxID=156173 RepID=A0A7S2IRG1_9EUKA|mmetsp:Transcript_69933/g.138593  ORF Transcript_69933/g.138593 Transcript_69933/m.138593 type:complete len:1809 (+) Transcript_69933:62-5488(+)
MAEVAVGRAAAAAAGAADGGEEQNEFMDMVDQVARQVPDVPESNKFTKRACLPGKWGLHRDHFPRRQCIAIVSDWRFDTLVLVLIGLNCITMTLFASPIVKNVLEYQFVGEAISSDDMAQKSLWASKHWTFQLLRPAYQCKLGDVAPCSIAQITDFIFLALFTVEMFLKLFAAGLWSGKKAYFKQGWNWLDFVVVTVGWLEFSFKGLPAINTIRLVKTLRPLRSMQRIRGLRVLVQSILDSLPQMGNVAVFLVFTIVLFGLFGHAFFKGRLRHACWPMLDDGTPDLDAGNTGHMCDAQCTWDEQTLELEGICKSLGNLTKHRESQDMQGIWSFTCFPGQECRCAESGEASAACNYLDNPNYGITSFDSLPWAMVSLFQAISLEGWVDMMYQVIDGGSDPGALFVVFYFILLVLFGAIIVMNLFLAVLCDNFEMADKKADLEGIEAEDDVDAEIALANMIQDLKHKNKLRQICLDLVKWKPFDYFIQGCILFNTLIMMMTYRPRPENNIVASISGSSRWDYLPYGYFWFLNSMNIILTLVFTVETVVKIIGLGPKIYRKDFMNMFDAFVVVFSVVEIGLDLNTRFNPGAATLPIPLSVLRAFRIFRLFKLVRSIDSLRRIISTLASSLRSVVYLALLLLLIILIFILLGMELFGGRYPHPEYNYTSYDFNVTWAELKIHDTSTDGGPSRYNFDDFGSALLSIFVVLSGENWNEIMFDSHRASWDYDTTSAFPFPWAIVYFLFLFVIGNLLLFNLFIAILLSNFDDDDEEETEDANEASLSADSEGFGKIKKVEPEWTWSFGQYRATNPRDSAVRKSGTGDETGSSNAESNMIAEANEKEDEEVVATFPATNAEGNYDKACKIFSWSNPIRRICAHTIMHRFFEPAVLALILLSTLTLIIDLPHMSQSSPLRLALYWINVVFTVLFTIEMLTKILASGFMKSKTPPQFALSQAYLRSGWNILDFIIVIISLISLGVPAAKQLRVFRAIRPMRLVSRYESLKITFQTLLKSIPAMGSLITVALLFFIIFGILGLELFGGKFGYCYDPMYDGYNEFGTLTTDGGRVIPGMKTVVENGVTIDQNDYMECMSLPRYNLTRRTTDGILLMDIADLYPNADPNWLEFIEFPQWLYPQFGSFDDMSYALVLLFEVSALEGWPTVMHWAMDTDSKHMLIQPWRVDTNPINWGDSGQWDADTMGAQPVVTMPTDSHVTSNIEAAVFFILWIIFGCFVIVNMTIGVVVDTFSRIKAENDGLLLMTEEAGDWVRTQKQVLAQRPLKAAEQPTSVWRLNFYYLVTSTKFEVLVMAIIMTNMVQMGLDWWEPAVNAPYMPTLKEAMSIINIFFFVIYAIEMLLKWVGIGLYQYFKNWWNCFDCILVIISLVDVCFSPPIGTSELPFPAAVLRVLRLFRVARILRIIKTAKQLRTIMMTVYISVPQLKNILVLIILIIIIVDMLLVGFFSHVNYTPGNNDFSDHTPTYDLARDTVSYQRGERYYAEDWHFSGDGTNWGDMINKHANFQYFWTGLLTLVRSSTGESFNGIMQDLYGWQWGHNRMSCCMQCGPILDGDIQAVMVIPSTNESRFNREEPLSSCGEAAPALIIYFLFQLVMAYIVLSIMIGIILENFANVGSETKKISLDDIEEFREVWLKYDPKGTFIVPSYNLLAILQQLKEPLGIQGKQTPMTRADMLKHLGKLDVPDHGGYIHFMETLTAVSNLEAGVPVPQCETTNKMARAALNMPHLKKLDKPAHNALTNYLVSLLQSRWRGYAMRRKYDADESTYTTAAELPADVTQQQPPPYEGLPSGKVKVNQVAPGPQ